jgi:hypothetical protein
MTARSDRRVALVAGLLLALLFTGCAAMQVAGWTVGAVERTSREVVPGPVRELRVDAGAGDITIVPALSGDVTIVTRATGSLHRPQLQVGVNGTDVTLTGGCSALNFGRCDAATVVHVPPGTAVTVNAASGDISASGITAPVQLITASGDVSASGLTGGADLRTSSGDVQARDLAGRVRLESASGDVQAANLRASSVRANSSSGEVALSFLSAPGDVDAETASGDVRVLLPRGKEAYRVEARTDNGDREIAVSRNATSARVIRARTNSGDAIVRYGN